MGQRTARLVFSLRSWGIAFGYWEFLGPTCTEVPAQTGAGLKKIANVTINPELAIIWLQ